MFQNALFLTSKKLFLRKNILFETNLITFFVISINYIRLNLNLMFSHQFGMNIMKISAQNI